VEGWSGLVGLVAFSGRDEGCSGKIFLAFRACYRGLIFNPLNIEGRKMGKLKASPQFIDLHDFTNELSSIFGIAAGVSKLFTTPKIYFVMWR
jgi:hypothetical protein